MQKSNNNYLYLYVIIFFCGVSNDPLSIEIIKEWKLVEILTIPLFVFLFISKNNFKVFNFQKKSFYFVSWCYISLVVNIGTFPFEHFVTDSKGLFTMYGTRGLLVATQLLFYIILSILLLNYLFYIKISQHELESIIVKSITLFSIIGIFIVCCQMLGFKFSFVQSNDLSYSSFRLFSLAREPQYAALWLSFGLLIAIKRRVFIPSFIILIAILLTRSSSVIAGLFVAFSWFYVFKVNIKVKLLLVPIVIIFTSFVFYLSLDKILSFYNSLINVNYATSDFARSYSMYVASKLIPEHFMAGIGLGNFPYFFEWRGEEKIFNIANIFIRILTECGIVGFTIFMVFISSIFRQFKKNADEYFCIIIVMFVYFMANSTYLFFVSFWLELALLFYLSTFTIGGYCAEKS
ncbi:TPA: O-antigen ligase family protein [Photobacterium damselae]